MKFGNLLLIWKNIQFSHEPFCSGVQSHIVLAARCNKNVKSLEIHEHECEDGCTELRVLPLYQ